MVDLKQRERMEEVAFFCLFSYVVKQIPNWLILKSLFQLVPATIIIDIPKCIHYVITTMPQSTRESILILKFLNSIQNRYYFQIKPWYSFTCDYYLNDFNYTIYWEKKNTLSLKQLKSYYELNRIEIDYRYHEHELRYLFIYRKFLPKHLPIEIWNHIRNYF